MHPETKTSQTWCRLPPAQELLNPLAEPGHEDFFGGRPVERVREAGLVGDTLDVLFESL